MILLHPRFPACTLLPAYRLLATTAKQSVFRFFEPTAHLSIKQQSNIIQRSWCCIHKTAVQNAIFSHLIGVFRPTTLLQQSHPISMDRRQKARPTAPQTSSLSDQELSALTEELRRVHIAQERLLQDLSDRANAGNHTLSERATLDLTHGFASRLSTVRRHRNFPSQPLRRPLRVGDPITVLGCVLVDNQISNDRADYLGEIISIESDPIFPLTEYLIVRTTSNRIIRESRHTLAYRDE